MGCGCGSTLVEGAAKIALSAVGARCADAATVRHRRDLCAQCAHEQRLAGALPICGLCHCVIWSKTRLKDEVCPDGRW